MVLASWYLGFISGHSRFEISGQVSLVSNDTSTAVVVVLTEVSVTLKDGGSVEVLNDRLMLFDDLTALTPSCNRSIICF
jgi:hypothetical protein